MHGERKIPPTLNKKRKLPIFLHKASVLHLLLKNIKFDKNFDKIFADISIFDDDVIKNPIKYTIY